ncbi:hypothetical protein U1Q18_052857 [Sarracenia purpurea var. burkii]
MSIITLWKLHNCQICDTDQLVLEFRVLQIPSFYLEWHLIHRRLSS